MSPSLYRLFVPCVFIYENIMYFKAKKRQYGASKILAFQVQVHQLCKLFDHVKKSLRKKPNLGSVTCISYLLQIFSKTGT